MEAILMTFASGELGPAECDCLVANAEGLGTSGSFARVIVVLCDVFGRGCGHVVGDVDETDRLAASASAISSCKCDCGLDAGANSEIAGYSLC